MQLTHRSRRSVIILAFLATVLIVGSAATALILARSIEPSNENEWLFTYGAESAQLEVADSGESGQLTLQNPDSTLLMFTDRPERRTATIAIESLADQWEKVFSSSPPNAALVDDVSGDAFAVLTLGRPIISSESVTFPVSITEMLSEEQSRGIQTGAHLFIDPPAARLTDFNEFPMPTPTAPISIPHVG